MEIFNIGNKGTPRKKGRDSSGQKPIQDLK